MLPSVATEHLPLPDPIPPEVEIRIPDDANVLRRMPYAHRVPGRAPHRPGRMPPPVVAETQLLPKEHRQEVAVEASSGVVKVVLLPGRVLLLLQVLRPRRTGIPVLLMNQEAEVAVRASTGLHEARLPVKVPHRVLPDRAVVHLRSKGTTVAPVRLPK